MEDENEESELNKNLNQELNANLNPPTEKTFEEEVEEGKEEIKETIEELEEQKKENSDKEELQEEKNSDSSEKPKEKDYFKEEKRIEKLRQLVEAVLFMSPQPIPLKEIAGICETPDLSLISELIEALRKDLIERKSGIEIIRETEGYRMQVLSELEVKVSHLAGPTRFSKGVMKTMAYIAFKQPVKQSTIVKFRTNKVYDEIKILEDHGFISREKAGITYVIKTTKKFLQYFGDDAVKLKKNPEFESQK